MENIIANFCIMRITSLLLCYLRDIEFDKLNHLKPQDNSVLIQFLVLLLNAVIALENKSLLSKFN